MAERETGNLTSVVARLDDVESRLAIAEKKLARLEHLDPERVAERFGEKTESNRAAFRQVAASITTEPL